MTAALLRQRLPPSIQITLIEASDIPVIGVGESTNPIMTHFQMMIGGDEKAMMRAANASFKIGIRYQDFGRLGHYYFHPFGAIPSSAAEYFKPNAQQLSPGFPIADLNNKFAKELPVYSFHIDAGLYGQHLKERHCKPKGVVHLLDKILGVTLDDKGAIGKVHTEKSGDIEADLYVDCSGFRSMLLEGALKEPFTSVTKYLPNDRAIATRVPYIDKDAELNTYTGCTAVSAGWIWNIPLYSRMGTGLVYSSAFMSKNDAEAMYRKHLGEARVKDLPFSHIEIKNGRHARAWVKNCVAVGISYGFLEPLESTGLSLTQIGIIDLADALQRGTYGSVERETYNHRAGELFDHTRDFIVAHYILTQREDTPYWQYLRNDAPIPDRLAAVLNELQHARNDILATDINAFYQVQNWNVVLSGLGFFDHGAAAGPTMNTPEPAGAIMNAPKPERVVSKGIPHAQFLKDTVFDGEYQPPAEPADSAWGKLHPIWFPTW
jgi:tryptophan halogenase